MAQPSSHADPKRPGPPGAGLERGVPEGGIDWRAYGWTVGLVMAATAISGVGSTVFRLPDMVMLFLLAIMLVAARFGRGPSVLAAILSVAAYDFFFVPPYLTFSVSETHHTLTFVMMFAIGLVISSLTTRIRRIERERSRLSEDARSAALRARTEEMRSSLLSAVSHDLRTPLAAITGAATMLRGDGPTIPAEQENELVNTICEEAERLERLVGNLLDMTRLESGSLKVKRDWIPIEELVVSALTRLEAGLAGRAVETELPDDLPLVSVDPVLLEQVFVNLLENALKYTPRGSPIDIRAVVTDGGMTIEVADRGPGLPPGTETQVFEKFFRASPTGRAGVGLGLAICRGIVEAHAGSLTVENRPGGGAVFRIQLPFVEGAPVVPADRELAPEEVAP